MTGARRLATFAAVGAGNALVDLLAFNVLVFLHPTRSSGLLVLYNTVAVLIALANSYIWNRRWTFRDRAAGGSGRRWRERVLFAGQGGVNLAVNDLTIWGLGQFVQPNLGLSAAVASNVSKVSAMIVSSATSYLLMHRLVFWSTGTPGPSSARPRQP